MTDYLDNSAKVSFNLSDTTTPPVLSSVSSKLTTSLSVSSIFKPLTIEEKVEGCMRMANLDSQQLITQARDNARYFLDEYRKVIPEKDLEVTAGRKSNLPSGNRA